MPERTADEVRQDLIPLHTPIPSIAAFRVEDERAPYELLRERMEKQGLLGQTAIVPSFQMFGVPADPHLGEQVQAHNNRALDVLDDLLGEQVQKRPDMHVVQEGKTIPENVSGRAYITGGFSIISQWTAFDKNNDNEPVGQSDPQVTTFTQSANSIIYENHWQIQQTIGASALFSIISEAMGVFYTKEGRAYERLDGTQQTMSIEGASEAAALIVTRELLDRYTIPVGENILASELDRYSRIPAADNTHPYKLVDLCYRYGQKNSLQILHEAFMAGPETFVPEILSMRK